MADATPTPAPTTPAAPADPNAKQWLIVLTNLVPIVLIYTMMKKGKEAFYLAHSKNAAGALVIGLVIQIVYRILWIIIPTLSIVFLILNVVYGLLGLLMIYGAYEGWQGKQPNLPVVTMIGQKIPLEKWFNKAEASMNTSAAVTPAAPASTPEPAPTPAPESPAAPAAPESTPPTPPTPPVA
jgi:hypothetical protein